MSDSGQRERAGSGIVTSVIDDPDSCYRASSTRDARFDGRFVMGVSSTGIYCRPSCPARTPLRENCSFHATPAAARAAGFRACLRCLPDASPGSPDWNTRADLAARAMQAIDDGAVARDGVSGLARRLHISERQLERTLIRELGAGPLALANARRTDTARTLIETTDIAFTQVAQLAGFGSLRRFNDAIRSAFARTPTELRRARRHAAAGRALTPADSIELRLPVRTPFASAQLFDVLGRRAIIGVEHPTSHAYVRSMALPGGHAVVTLRPAADHVACTVQLTSWADLPVAVQRCRRLLDLDADPVGIDEALAHDPMLAPLIARTPGLRSPGSVDAFEVAVRAVLGQVVTVEAGRRVTQQLVELCAPQLTIEHPSLTHVFPGAAQVAGAELQQLPIPARRRDALGALARAVVHGDLDLAPGADREQVRASLLALPGIGPWTASYVLMRGFASPDEQLPGDAAIRAGAGDIGDAAAWRPWRSYAMHHLWNDTHARPTEPT